MVGLLSFPHLGDNTMWLPIILICSSPYVQSCNIITGLELLETKEACFKEVEAKATIILNNPGVFHAKPSCQIMPEKIVGVDT
tara:strand:+ start:1832 stop:2080 length:249 start_codon:yes stop_codon:yes gene_type:complete